MHANLVFALAVALAMPVELAAADLASPDGLGIFFTEAPTRCLDSIAYVGAFERFDFYVTSFSVRGGLEAYELAVTLPAGGVVTGGRILPDGATDFGHGDDNWIVGTGGVCVGEDGWFTLVRYAGVLFLGSVPSNTRICFTGSTPTSFPDGMPGYLLCASAGELRSFVIINRGCAVLNDLGVWCGDLAVAPTSFGALKTSF